MPGTDAGVLFRKIGAAAERYLQIGEDSAQHAKTGLTYIDEILSQCADQSAADLDQILAIRAELLLLSDRHTEACEQAEALQSSSDPSVRTVSVVIKARCDLTTGNPQAAAESLAQVAPTTDHALEEWRATWIGDTGDRYWTDRSDALSMPLDSACPIIASSLATASFASRERISWSKPAMTLPSSYKILRPTRSFA